MIKYFCFLMCMLSSVTAFAQPLKQVEVIEPTAASLAKYGTYQVNYSTGLPEISIPLYTVKSGELSLDLALSYHGGGVKLNENASWVGLGWDISLGGTITRQVYGLPDELENFQSLPTQPDMSRHFSDNINNYYDPYLSSLVDGFRGNSFMHDVYHFNIGGHSGSFVLNNQNQPMLIPYSPVSITGSPSSGFTVTAPDGTNYYFRIGDITEDYKRNAEVNQYCSTWYIDKIVSANRTDSITFDYQEDGWITDVSEVVTEGIETAYTGCFSVRQPKGSKMIPLTKSANNQSVHSLKLKYITFKGGRVSFNLEERNDIYTAKNIYQPGSQLKRLGSLLIEQKAGMDYTPIKSYLLSYSYFISENPYPTPGNPSKLHPNCLRLKLDSVTVRSSINHSQLVAKLSYYYDKPFEPKYGSSYSTDYWGYYNGAWNTTPIPRSLVKWQNMSSYQWVIFGNADKAPNETYMITGCLKSVEYPTGGLTNFEWEMNRYAAQAPIANIYQKGEVSVNAINDTISHDDPLQSRGEGSVPSTDVFDVYVAQPVEVNFALYLKDSQNEDHIKYDRAKILLIAGNDTTVISDQIPSSGKKTIFLTKNKRYTLLLQFNCSNISGNCNFAYNSYNPEPDGKKNYPAGGLRIKAIASYGSDGALTGKKRFEYINPDSGNSSGILNSEQNLNFTKTTGTVSSSTDANQGVTITTTESQLCYSNPISGVYSNQVSYEYVQEFTEKQNGTSDGYTEYQFTVAQDNESGEDVPPVSSSWMRGQLLRSTVYRNGSSPQKVKETVNYYSCDARVDQKADGFHLKQFLTVSSYTYCNDITLYDIFKPTYYSYVQKWFHQDSTSTTEYYENGLSSTSTTKTFYDNPLHTEVTRSISTSSDGSVKTVKRKYPQDYAPATAAGLDALVDRGMIGTLVEERELLQRPEEDAARTVASKVTDYRVDEFGHVVPATQWTLRASAPFLLTEGVDAQGRYSNLLPGPDGTYKSDGQFKFDANGMLVDYEDKTDLKSSFTWDSKSVNLLGKAVNVSSDGWFFRNLDSLSAEPRQGAQLAYSPENNNIPVCALQGHGAYLSQAIPANQLKPNTRYTVEVVGKVVGQLPGAGYAVGANKAYFADSNRWESVRLEVTTGAQPSDLLVSIKSNLDGTSSGAGTLYVLAVRVYPADAQVTSYTWEPLVGVTSKTDASGKVTAYEYDSLGRLSLIKDAAGNVLKRYDYHYKQ